MMAAVDDLEEQSQQQHRRFYELFGADPAAGEGFTDVSNLGWQVGEQAQEARSGVINSNFSTAVIPALAGATSGDHHPFNEHARTATTAAKVSDASAQVNTRGAAAVLANSRNEAAQFAAIPDRDSPEGMITALNTISSNQAKSLGTVKQSAATEQQLGQQAAQGSGTDLQHNGVRAVDYKTGGGGDEDDKDNGHGIDKSWGKGSKTHIQQHGDPEHQWGHPTDPHEAWPNVPGKTGTFDGDHGGWDWHGPGRQGEAFGSQTPDGVGGHAGVDAWGAKGDAHWSRDLFGHQLDTSASGEIGAHANADGALTDHGVSAGGYAFLGGEIAGKGDYHLGPVDLSLGGAAQYGVGGSAHLDVGMQDGKFVLGGTLGLAAGPGGKISPHIAIDPKAVVGGLQKAEQWLEGLFN
jgi:hypothetical protein